MSSTNCLPRLRPMKRKRERAASDDDHVDCDKVDSHHKVSNKQRKKQPARPATAKECLLTPSTTSPQSSERLPVDTVFSCNNPLEAQPLSLPLLTERNLRDHTLQTSPEGQQDSAGTASTMSSSNRSVYDTEFQLELFGVRMRSTAPFPPLLEQHIDTVVMRARHAEEVGDSPSAKNLAKRAAWAQFGNEWRAMRILNSEIMFPCAAEPGGEKYITLIPEAQFKITYVTNPNDSTHSLTQPKPDQTNRYITRREAKSLIEKYVDAPFTAEEEQKLFNDPALPPIHDQVLCPFYTSQFKSADAKSPWTIGPHQAARDGVAVNEYMHQLYTRAGVAFTEVDTQHWSVVCDTKFIALYIHWRDESGGEVQYHMSQLMSTPLEADRGEEYNHNCRLLRDRLRNILEYAQGTRLNRIKHALSHIPTPAKSSPRKSKASTTQASGSPKKSVQFDEGYGPSVASNIFANQPDWSASTPRAPTNRAPPLRGQGRGPIRTQPPRSARDKKPDTNP